MFNFQDPGGLSDARTERPRSGWLPALLAAIIVVAAAAAVVFVGGRPKGPMPTSGATATPDPYTQQLAITDIKMSEASNFAGSKVTYLEGRLSNKGLKTVTDATVQVSFKNQLGEVAQRDTEPILLIRTREPYVDTQPMEAAPLKPGSEADFRLVFDHIADDWNQQYPVLTITAVQAQ